MNTPLDTISLATINPLHKAFIAELSKYVDADTNTVTFNIHDIKEMLGTSLRTIQSIIKSLIVQNVWSPIGSTVQKAHTTSVPTKTFVFNPDYVSVSDTKHIICKYTYNYVRRVLFNDDGTPYSPHEVISPHLFSIIHKASESTINVYTHELDKKLRTNKCASTNELVAKIVK